MSKHQLLKQNSQTRMKSVRINSVNCKMHQYDFVVVVLVISLQYHVFICFSMLKEILALVFSGVQSLIHLG